MKGLGRNEGRLEECSFYSWNAKYPSERFHASLHGRTSQTSCHRRATTGKRPPYYRPNIRKPNTPEVSKGPRGEKEDEPNERKSGQNGQRPSDDIDCSTQTLRS